MKISKSELPNNSILKSSQIAYDYVDSFQGVFIDKNDEITSTAIGKFFFTSGPKWIYILFAIRNKIVGLIGLKTSGEISDRKKMLDNFKGEKGQQMGLFKVFDKTSDEIVIGEDDKHLNFRVSLFIDKQSNGNSTKTLIISTTVKFNNWFGRIYFLLVGPFHKLIVPAMQKAIINKIEKQN